MPRGHNVGNLEVGGDDKYSTNFFIFKICKKNLKGHLSQSNLQKENGHNLLCCTSPMKLTRGLYLPCSVPHQVVLYFELTFHLKIHDQTDVGTRIDALSTNPWHMPFLSKVLVVVL